MAFDDVVRYLSELVKIDTTNPPGDEVKAAVYVKQQLETLGIPTNVYESSPGRGNAVARLKGDGSKRPFMLLSHLDVVNAMPEQWSKPPFSGEVADGVVFGRGSQDCKNATAIGMGIVQRLKQDSIRLKRDVILAATADEEAGGRAGVGWLCENVPHEMDAEFCVNEGGGNVVVINNIPFYACNVAEKSGTRLRLIGRGEPGHASVWKSDTAIARLSEAILRISRTRLPIHQTTATVKFFEGLARGLGYPISLVSAVFDEKTSVQTLEGLAGKDTFLARSINSMIRNTANPTIVNAGYRINIIPEKATADVDGRILPGQTPDGFTEEVRKLVGDIVDIEVLSRGTPTESPSDTPLFTAIEGLMKEKVVGSRTIPMLCTGGTDARFLRPRGTVTYGFIPMLPGEPVETAHGIDERVTIKGLEFGFETLYELVLRMCC